RLVPGGGLGAIVAGGIRRARGRLGVGLRYRRRSGRRGRDGRRRRRDDRGGRRRWWGPQRGGARGVPLFQLLVTPDGGPQSARAQPHHPAGEPEQAKGPLGLVPREIEPRKHHFVTHLARSLLAREPGNKHSTAGSTVYCYTRSRKNWGARSCGASPSG